MLLKRIVNRVGRPLGVNFFPRSFENPLAREGKRDQEIFDEICQLNFWASDESRSGVGSEIGFAGRYRRRLRDILERRGFKKIFDAPCGDLNWIAQMVREDGFEYDGGDISQEVVRKARDSNPDLGVRVFDIAHDDFPESDVWHCRDCLFHLPNTTVLEALANFSRSTIPYALITSHRAVLRHENLDVRAGGFRFLDLERAPFFLPPPIERIPDFAFGREFPRYVCLWSRAQISDVLRENRQ